MKLDAGRGFFVDQNKDFTKVVSVSVEIKDKDGKTDIGNLKITDLSNLDYWILDKNNWKETIVDDYTKTLSSIIFMENGFSGGEFKIEAFDLQGRYVERNFFISNYENDFVLPKVVNKNENLKVENEIDFNRGDLQVLFFFGNPKNALDPILNLDSFYDFKTYKNIQDQGNTGEKRKLYFYIKNVPKNIFVIFGPVPVEVL